MSYSGTQIFSRIVVYFLMICHLLGGLLELVSTQRFRHENPYSDPTFTKVTAVISLGLGILLLLGVVQENYRFFIVYLGVTTPMASLVTLQGLIAITHTAEMLPLIMLCLTVMWGLMYFVYLYYRELVRLNKERIATVVYHIEHIKSREQSEVILEKV